MHRNMMIWTLALAIGLGFLVAAFMLQPPATVRLGEKIAKRPAVLQPPRHPASVDESATESAVFNSVTLDERNQQLAVELTLRCKGPQHSLFAPGVKQVRLTGEACTPSREIASTEILNEANGFSATVFFPNARSFTTDYISLAPGPNRLRILHVFKTGGREERDYVVDRQRE